VGSVSAMSKTTQFLLSWLIPMLKHEQFLRFHSPIALKLQRSHHHAFG
jgi:hypothetical protein